VARALDQPLRLVRQSTAVWFGEMAPKVRPMPRERQDFLARQQIRRCPIAAVPFGKSSDKIGNHEDLVDERSVRLARFCGYQIGFTTAHGAAKLGDDLLRLPRIEIRGGWQLDQFIGALGHSR
jgi:hypothetical protein